MKKMNKGRYHEIAHLSYILGNMVEHQIVLEIHGDPKLKKAASKAMYALYELYQLAGEKM